MNTYKIEKGAIIDHEKRYRGKKKHKLNVYSISLTQSFQGCFCRLVRSLHSQSHIHLHLA